MARMKGTPIRTRPFPERRPDPMARLAAVAGILAVVLLLLLAFAPPADAHTGIPVSTWDRLAQCTPPRRQTELHTGNSFYGGLSAGTATRTATASPSRSSGRVRRQLGHQLGLR